MSQQFVRPADFRRDKLLTHVNLADQGLEIGAFLRPTVLKTEGNIKYLDFYTTEELRDQAAVSGEALQEVVTVDYVARDDQYDKWVDSRFDYIIANHVFEHVSNPIRWLQMLCGMLNSNGILFLAVPDKKYSFDRYRLDTQLSHLLYDHFSELAHIHPEHSLESALYYDRKLVGKEMEIESQFDIERLRRDTQATHTGIHSHVFQAEYFLEKILNPILYMKLVDFHLIDLANSKQFGEFIVVLKKGWQPVQMRLEDFYTPAADTYVAKEQ